VLQHNLAVSSALNSVVVLTASHGKVTQRQASSTCAFFDFLTPNKFLCGDLNLTESNLYFDVN
jgi:hypothetical protein